MLLAVLLVFPMVYQTVHLFHDHGLRIQSNDAPLTVNKNVEFHSEFDDCLICDFDYVVFLADEQIPASSELQYLVLDYALTQLDIPFHFEGFNKLLRAPPAYA